MTTLLEKYYKLENEYKTNPAENFDDLKIKSAEHNRKLALVLEQMNVQELEYLRERTSGPMRSVIADYLNKARRQNKSGKKKAGAVDGLAIAQG